jgi:hypothetical protein
MDLINKRVHRGAHLLDQKLPGWFFSVDLEHLNLANGCSCVLGQLACDIVPRKRWFRTWRGGGDRPFYNAACDYLALGDHKAETHGFAITSEDRYSYDDLNAAWKRYIAARRNNR